MISWARAGDDQFPEVLGRDGGALGFRGIDGGLGDRGGRASAVFRQPGLKSDLASAADPVRGPVFGEQQQGSFGTVVVKGPLQRGAGLVPGPQGLQVLAAPDGVGSCQTVDREDFADDGQAIAHQQ